MNPIYRWAGIVFVVAFALIALVFFGAGTTGSTVGPIIVSDYSARNLTIGDAIEVCTSSYPNATRKAIEVWHNNLITKGYEEEGGGPSGQAETPSPSAMATPSPLPPFDRPLPAGP